MKQDIGSTLIGGPLVCGECGCGYSGIHICKSKTRFIGIVGNSGSEITEIGEIRAKEYILRLLMELREKHDDIVVVSGGCPYGGIDDYAEAIAEQMKLLTKIFKPIVFNWNGPGGYKDRNIKIADLSDEVHVIVVNQLPHDGKESNYCYHCDEKGHVPSGGCWTGNYAKKLGKETEWHIIDNRPEDEIPPYKEPFSEFEEEKDAKSSTKQ